MRRQLFSLLVVLCLAVGTLSAATFEAVTDAALVERSQVVVVGRVIDAAARQRENGSIVTDYRLAVEEVLKGRVTGTTITISEFGGTAPNGLVFVIPGSASYEPGSHVVAFLDARTDGTYFTSHMALGKFRFETRRGIEILTRDEDGLELQDEAHSLMPRDAGAFLTYVRAAADGSQVEPYSATVKLPSSDRFTPVTNAGADYAIKSGSTPIRWENCETNCLIGYLTNGDQPGVANDGASIDNAMDAWNDHPASFVNLGRGGTSTATDLTVFDGQNNILLNNTSSPDFGLCNGTIACGGVWANTNTSHVFNGTTYLTVLNGEMLVRPATYTATQFESIVAHELGHTLSLRHSNQGTPSSNSALMRSNPPLSGAILQQWDMDAMASLYGNGIPCSAPTITNTSGAGTVTSGTTRNLSVTATGTAPFTYQWYRGNSGDTSTPVGTNSSSYNTPPITAQTTFWVRVTNSCGTADSNNITINVQSETCTAVAITTQPQSQNVAPNASVTLTVAVSGTAPFTYQWYRGTLGDTSTPVGSNSFSYTTPPLTSSTSFWVRASNGCGTANSTQANLTVSTVCVPASIVSSPTAVTVALGDGATLNVTVAGDAPFSYQWYQGESGDTTTPVTTGGGGPSLAVGPFFSAGTFKYWVTVGNGCGFVNSPTAVITVACGSLTTPVLSAPPIIHYSLGYNVQWLVNDPASVGSFELQEALNADFTSGLRTFIVHDVEQHIDPHVEVVVDTRFYYRVRAISACNQTTTNYSTLTSTVVTRPQAANSLEFSISVPDDATQVFTQDYLVPGFGDTATSGDTFSIATDVPWLSVFPTTGALSAGGTTVQFTINPSLLSVGSTTGTFVVTRTQGSSKGGPAANASTAVSFPFTISKVTPVTPAPRDANAPVGTLLVPAIAHADGIGTRFQSDVRIVNASTGDIEYELSYTPSNTNGTESGKKLNLTIAGNETKGLDDIVKAWYGSGVLGEAGLGTLEIRPLNNASPTATFASSRTYAISATGTLGQFIPAIGIEKFIGNIAQDSLAKISLQQIANSNAFRTNLGFVEGSGTPVTLRLTLKDALNNPLKVVEKSLTAYGHEQTSFAAVFGNIAVNDARVEVEVISPGGKASAYASVLDNATSDPLLVFPVQAQKVSAQHYVVPGVAELDNGPSSNFHTDMRVFNAAATPVTVALAYFPQNGDSTPRPANVNLTLGPGEVRSLDNILPTVWGLSRTGGAVAVDAPAAANLVLTARTFSRDSAGGTYGQFIPGVTATDGVGLGERALEILQLEQSAQYRSNLGLVEVTGNPVKVEVTGQTGSKLTARTEFTLAGNEFRQVGRIFEQMGFGSSVYTGRVSIRVIEGAGKIAGYGSVVDNRTVDPTYVPSQ
jgi:hypothetical protein